MRVRRALALSGMTLMTGVGLTLASPSSASADDVCVDYTVTMPFIHPVGGRCAPYIDAVRCETLEGGLWPTVYAVVDACIPTP